MYVYNIMMVLNEHHFSLFFFLVGRKKKKNPFIVTVKQNFSTIMHPFSVTSEWCKGLGDKNKIKLNG